MQSTDAEAAVMSGGRSIAVAQFEAAQGRRARWILVLRLLVGVAFLAFWEFSSGRLIDKLFISSASAVFTRLAKWVMDGTLVNHLSITLYATMWGFLIGSFVGFAMGLLFGRFRALAEVLDPYITAHGDVYRVQVLGFSDGGGPVSRLEALIDATKLPPRIISQRDLNELGRGYTRSQLLQVVK